MKKHFRKEVAFLLLLLLALGVVAQTTSPKEPKDYQAFCTQKDPVSGTHRGVAYDHGSDGVGGLTGDYQFFEFNDVTGEWIPIGGGTGLDGGIPETIIYEHYNCTP